MDLSDQMALALTVLWALCGLIGGLMYRSVRSPQLTALLGAAPFGLIVMLGPVGLVLVSLWYTRRKRQ